MDGVDHVYTGPNGWGDISREQLLAWSGVLRQSLSVDEALLLACYLLYRIPKAVYMRLPAVVDVHLRHRMEWLLDNMLTNNVIGYVRVWGLSYYGPAHRLSNISIGEYRYTELYYDMYLKSGERRYLLLLCAVLFRPRGGNKGDDVRSAIVERTVMRRAKLFGWAVHPDVIKAIQLQYEGCRRYVRKCFPLVYPEAGDLGPGPQGWRDVIQDMEDHILAYSGGKLGTYSETKETNLYVFMKLLSQRIEEYNSRKK